MILFFENHTKGRGGLAVKADKQRNEPELKELNF